MKNILSENGIESQNSSNFVIPAEDSKMVVGAAVDGRPQMLVEVSSRALGMSEPLLEELSNLTNQSIYILSEKMQDPESIESESISSMSSVVERLIKLKQLLSGGVTDNVGIMASNLSKRIVRDNSDDIYR